MSEDRTPTKIPQGRWGVEAFSCPKAVGLNLSHVGGIQNGVNGLCQKGMGQRRLCRKMCLWVGLKLKQRLGLLVAGQKLDMLLCQ